MRLALHSWGDGPRTALLVHGATGTGAGMAPLAAPLVARGYRVLAPDLRGHGASPRTAAYPLQALADDLVETLRGERVELAAGHSLGGKVLPGAVPGLRPDRVLYLDPAWTASPDDPFAAAMTHPDGSPMDLDDLRRLHPGAAPEALRARLETYLACDWRMFHDPLLRLRSTTVPPVPAQAPSLVVTADPSRLVPPDLAATLRAGGYRVVAQPGAGHGLFHQDMAGFLAVAGEWLG